MPPLVAAGYAGGLRRKMADTKHRELPLHAAQRDDGLADRHAGHKPGPRNSMLPRKKEFALYKAVLRPFIRDADLYHISQRPDGVHWDAYGVFLPQHGTGVVYVFRGSDSD